MRRTIEFFLCILLVSLAFSAYGQVEPAARAHEPTLTVGGFGSAFQPDYAGNGIAQSSPNPLIGIGAYVDFRVTYGGFTPYGKFLVGIGSGSFLNGHSTVLAFGGGVDYRLNRRFTLRAADFEFQEWTLTPTLHPYGGSVGLGYKLW
jgi:hypothetical protein